MAENEEVDLDQGKASGGKKKMIIIIIVLTLVLIGAGVGGALMFMGGGEEASEGAEQVAEELPKKALYLPLKKMIVNLPKGPARFLQVEMQLMSYDQAALDAVNEYMPVIRNDILLQLAGYNYEELSTFEGKEQLRTRLQETIQTILKEQAGMEEGISAIYFTSFVMQ
jgi:flagellar FliL protein